ncbi:hypothetical protein [Pseudomonas sp. SLFW]|uniref:head-tail joining protein n=1 Tax=Pseudomonas sp. SLFW TaxID=2683259 RepID=UPI0014135CB2|nr:hypothetical protein [Pseudomonas sp. SLFW]NBB09545.1 hypothetical protein [Pseudomonas sp. SLFW]
MAFRDLVADVDDTVFDVLSDSAQIEGRPVAGMFSAPWLQPVVGRLNTGLREPHFVMRVAEAVGVDQGQAINIDLPALDGGGPYTITRLEPDGSGLVSLVLRMKP